MRESWFNPLGLITQPNELGQYPAGAMSLADNLVARAPGELVVRQQDQSYGNFTGTISTDYPAAFVFTGFQALLIEASTVGNNAQALWHDGAAVSAGAMPGDLAAMYTAQSGWGQFVIFRNRLFLCSESDVLVFDSLNPSSSALRAARRCGMPQPIISNIFFTGSGQAAGGNTVCGYGALIKRTYSDGYEIISPPSLLQRFANSSTYDPDVTVALAGSGLIDGGWQIPNVQVGDVVELYRTQGLTYNSFNNVNELDPGTTMYLVASVTLSSADVAAGFLTIHDNAKLGKVGDSFGGLGRPCYTNPGQVGLEGVNIPPPAAKRIATYKGRMFYANYATPGDVTVAYHGGFGMLGQPAPGQAGVEARANGIGTRPLSSGTSTSGSPTVTGVSANDMIGVVPGQRFDAQNWSFLTTYVQSVGANTITMTRNATITGATSLGHFIVDQIESSLGGTANLYDAGNFRYRYAASARTLVDSNLVTFDQAFYFTNLFTPTGNLSLRATNGQNYDPKLPLITAVNNAGVVTGATPQTFPPKQFKNGLRWSKDQQPEHVPPSNEIFIGQGEIYGMYSTRDALWIFASDGLWRLSGTMTRVGQQVDVRVDPVDSTLILAAPTAGCVLRDSVYAYTNRGLVRVDDNGVMEISDMRVGDLLPGAVWTTQPLYILSADEANDDIYISIRTSLAKTTTASTTYVYSTLYNIFTNLDALRLVTTGRLSCISRYWFDKVQQSLFTVGGAATIDIANRITNTGSISNLIATVDFQPIYGQDPFMLKQWIDCTVVFGSEAAGKLSTNPRWDGVVNTIGSGANAPRLSTSGKDARINFGVPRSVAVGNMITFGIEVPASTLFVYTLKGVSFRFEWLTDQQVLR